MKTFYLGALLFLASFLPLSGQEEDPLVALEREYLVKVEEAQESLLGFEKRYLEELKKVESTAQLEGELEEFLAAQKEAEGFAKGPIPDLEKYPRIKKLREIYESSLPPLKAEAIKGQVQALQDYINGLATQVSSLTAAGEIDKAVETKALQERLTLELSSLQQSGVSTTKVTSISAIKSEIEFVSNVDTIPALQGKKGRVRSIGLLDEGEAVIPPEAEEIDDFVRVYAFDRSWVGVREDGSTFIKYIRPIKLTVHLAEERDIRMISRGHDGWFVNRRDEFWRICEPQRVFEAERTPDGIIGCHCAGLAYRKDGTAVTGGSQFDPNRKIPPPEDFFKDAIGACSGASTMIAVDPGGTLRGWEIDLGQPFAFDGVSDVIEIEGGKEHAVIRKSDGRVETLAIRSLGSGLESSMIVPADLGGEVARIRAGGQTSAIQRTDGTWFAWGPNTQVNEAINGAGVAIDLDVFGLSNRGYAIWIEPVE